MSANEDWLESILAERLSVSGEDAGQHKYMLLPTQLKAVLSINRPPKKMTIPSLAMNAGSLATILGSLVQPALAQNIIAIDKSRTIFSSSFQQPEPPMVQSEFMANFNQHKWDVNVSHITSGFVYHSPSQEKVRVDEAWESTFASSFFDYTNVTQEGVANRLWSLSPAITSPPQCFKDFVNPALPLVSEDILVANNAIYSGTMHDALAGEVVLWDILYQGVIPVTVLLDGDNVIQGYDFLGQETRARVITRFFNIILGPVGSDAFDFPC